METKHGDEVPETELSKLISELHDEASAATWCVGYMKAVLDEPIVAEKIDDSYSGYALQVATAAVKRILVLYCSRSWDERRDTISLPTVTDRVNKIIAKIETQGEPSDEITWDEITKSRWSDYMADYDRAAHADECRNAIRVFRSEWLAHRVESSHDRLKFGKEKPIGTITISQLVNRAENTILLVRKLERAINRRATAFPDRISSAERYCREFWRVLPVLKTVENPANLCSPTTELDL